MRITQNKLNINIKGEQMLNKVIIGIVAGFISGFFGAGGGLILVPAFSYFFYLSEKESRATSIYAILPMVLVSGIYYYNNNYTDFNIGIKAAIGGMIGAILGSIILKKISSNILKISFAIFLIYMGIKMFFN